MAEEIERDLRSTDEEVAMMAVDGLVAVLLDIEESGELEGESGDPDFVDAARAYARLTRLLVPDLADEVPEDRSVVDQCGRAAAAVARLGDARLDVQITLLHADALDRAGRADDGTAAIDTCLARLPERSPYRDQLMLTSAKRWLGRGELERARDLAERVGVNLGAAESPHPALVAAYRGLRVEFCLRVGLLEEAATWAAREMAVAEKARSKKLIADAHLHAVDCALARGGLERVEEFVERALATPGCAELEPHGSILRYQHALSLASSGWSDPSSNAVALRDFVALAEDANLPADLRLPCHVWIADLHLRLGDPEAAAEAVASARAEAGPGTDLDSECLLLATECKLALLSKAEIDEAEMRALRDRLVDELGRFFERWDQAPIRREGTAFLHFAERRKLISELIRITLALDPAETGVVRALELVHRAQARGSRARAAGYAPVPLDAWRADLVTESGGMLVVLPAADRTHVFAVERERVRHFEALHRTELRDRFDRFERWTAGRIRSGDEDVFLRSPVGEIVRDGLFTADLREVMADWSAVTVVGLDAVGPLSLEALPWTVTAKGETVLFGDAFSVTHLSSIPVGVLLDAPATTSAGGMWIVGAPPGEVAGPSIPLGDAWIERLTEGFDEGTTRVLDGPDAVPSSLRSPGLRDALVLHLVTHGVVRVQERPHGLALASSEDDDGLVFAEDIERLQLPPIVVVSSCRAAGGVVPIGDDSLAGLTSAFLDAGARWVILARHVVEFEAAMALAESFGRHLRTGARPGEALRRARVDLAEDDRAHHPSYRLMQVVGRQ